MTWVIPWSRRSARIQRVDDAPQMINGFLCDAALRALILSCPACGELHDIKATASQSPVFEREKQRFRCNRCRFRASLHVIADPHVSGRKEVVGRRSRVGQCHPSCQVPPVVPSATPYRGGGTVALGNGAVPLALEWHTDGTGTRSAPPSGPSRHAVQLSRARRYVQSERAKRATTPS